MSAVVYMDKWSNHSTLKQKGQVKFVIIFSNSHYEEVEPLAFCFGNKRSVHWVGLIEMLLYILVFLFRVRKFSFYQSWVSMNVSMYVAILVIRISIGDEKVKLIIDCDPVESF